MASAELFPRPFTAHDTYLVPKQVEVAPRSCGSAFRTAQYPVMNRVECSYDSATRLPLLSCRSAAQCEELTDITPSFVSSSTCSGKHHTLRKTRGLPEHL